MEASIESKQWLQKRYPTAPLLGFSLSHANQSMALVKVESSHSCKTGRQAEENTNDRIFLGKSNRLFTRVAHIPQNNTKSGSTAACVYVCYHVLRIRSCSNIYQRQCFSTRYRVREDNLKNPGEAAAATPTVTATLEVSEPTDVGQTASVETACGAECADPSVESSASQE